MDEVKDMLDGTKTSVEHLLPKSDEIFNQVKIQPVKINSPNVLIRKLDEIFNRVIAQPLKINGFSFWIR